MPKLKCKRCLGIAFFCAVLAFGLYHVHAQSGVTEGGLLGLSLLLYHHFAISPAVTAFVANVICYAVAFRYLGKEFLGYSAVAVVSFSLFYRLFECFPPLFLWLSDVPMLAALLGALFVGVGVGGAILLGGAPSGDDALAVTLSRLLRVPIAWVYFFFDLAVLLPSLTYIPLTRILYSVFTVMLSSQIVGWIQKIPLKKQP